MSLSEADILEYYLRALPFVQDVKIFERTCDAIVKYNREADHRERLIDALCDFSYRDEYALSLVPEDSGRAMNRYYQEKLFWKVVLHGARMLFGNDNRLVLPSSAILGALFLLCIDTIARSVSASELPLSVLTAAIGAPVFIVLLRKTGGIQE